MIVERGRVQRLDGRYAWVDCQPRSDCQLCREGRGCGEGLLARVFRRRPRPVRALAPGRRLMPGAAVQIGFSEATLLRAACLLYLLPLASMLAGAALAQALAAGSDPASAAGAALGLTGGVAVARLASGRVAGARRHQPRILEELPGPATPVSPGDTAPLQL